MFNFHHKTAGCLKVKMHTAVFLLVGNVCTIQRGIIGLMPGHKYRDFVFAGQGQI